MNGANDNYICKVYKKELENDAYPKSILPQKIRQNKSIRIMKKLDELEEIWIALSLSFLQIRELEERYRRLKLWLIGGVINIPTDTFKIQYALSHDINDTNTIAIVIKKSLRLKNSCSIMLNNTL